MKKRHYGSIVLILFGAGLFFIGHSFPSNWIQVPSGPAGGTASAATGFIQTLTAPTAASFTAENYNGNGNVTTQTNNSTPVTSISLLQNSVGGSAQQMVFLDKAELAATFTVTEAMTLAGDLSGGNAARTFLVLTDGTKLITFDLRCGSSGAVFEIGQWNSSTSFTGTTPYAATNVFTFAGPLLWLRIQETAMTRSYSMSSDGTNFALVFSEAENTFLTTTRYGWGVSANIGGGNGSQAMGTLYSFTETNP